MATVQLENERPLGPNEWIRCHNEQTGRTELSKTTVQGVQRMAFCFKRREDYHQWHLPLMQRLISFLGTVALVGVWPGTNRAKIRSLATLRRMESLGGETDITSGAGVVTMALADRSLIDALALIAATELGIRSQWFIACGPLATPHALVQAPFEPSVTDFSHSSVFSPSVRFLRATGEIGGAFSYVDASDDISPRVIVVAADSMANDIENAAKDILGWIQTSGSA